MAAPIVHVEVRGLDQPELAEFYRSVFGWEKDGSLSIDGYDVGHSDGAVTLATGTVAPWQANSATFYIQVDDIDDTLDRIESAGGRRVMPKQVGPADFPAEHIRVFTKFVDPAGNIVGLVERPKE